MSLQPEDEPHLADEALTAVEHFLRGGDRGGDRGGEGRAVARHNPPLEGRVAVRHNPPRDRAPQRLLFVSKSLGTVVAAEVARRLGLAPLRHLWLTPLPAALPAMLAAPGAVVVGTDDPFFDAGDVRALAANPSLAVHTVFGANHSLLIPGDHRASLAALAKVCACCEALLDP